MFPIKIQDNQTFRHETKEDFLLYCFKVIKIEKRESILFLCRGLVLRIDIYTHGLLEVYTHIYDVTEHSTVVTGLATTLRLSQDSCSRILQREQSQILKTGVLLPSRRIQKSTGVLPLQ